MGSLQEERVPFDLDIRVWGMATDGRAFSQHARTQNISASGARLCEIEHDVEIGDTIGVQAGQKKTRCKVVWARDSARPQEMGPAQNCLPHCSPRRPNPGARHCDRCQRQRLLCRDAFAFSHRNRARRRALDWDGKGYDTRLSAHLGSESWHGNRIRRFENRRSAAFSGPSSGCLPLQLLNRGPKPKVKKSSQLEQEPSASWLLVGSPNQNRGGQ